jgi:eukaryotic-like serine/threonine-protein kinase
MSASELPPLIGGKYRPLRLLGQGAMGRVYAVEHVVTGEHLALKILTSALAEGQGAEERFKREARASAKIKSDSVVRVIDADVCEELDRAPYLVMDLLEGFDLEQASERGGQPPGVVIDWLRQVAKGLDKAHQLGIIHRDLKPENLFLARADDGAVRIKILDFGIARFASDAPGATRSGQILGTPLYMSPEQARAELVGPMTDLYSLGLIAYRLLVGETYWSATSVAGILAQVLYEPMTAPSERGSLLGPRFDQWFLRACARDPTQRFPTARDQIEALASALDVPGLASGVTDVPLPEFPITPGQRLPSGARSGARSQPENQTLAAASDSSRTQISSEMPVAKTRSLSSRRISFLTIGAVGLALLLGAAILVRRSAEPKSTGLAVAAEPMAIKVPEPRTEGSGLVPVPSVAAEDSARKETAGLPPRATAAPPATAPRKREAPRPPKRSGAPDRPAPDDPLSDQK